MPSADWQPIGLTVQPADDGTTRVYLPIVVAPMACEVMLADKSSRLTILTLPPALSANPVALTPAAAAAALAAAATDPDYVNATANGTAGGDDDDDAAGAIPALLLLLGLLCSVGVAILVSRCSRFHRAWSRKEMLSSLGLEREGLTSVEGYGYDENYTAL